MNSTKLQQPRRISDNDVSSVYSEETPIHTRSLHDLITIRYG